VRSEVHTPKTGKTTQESRFYLSSQEPKARPPEQWHHLIRGHWAGVEIRNHWRRDHLWREDASRTNKIHALANLALLRNALLTLTPVHYPAVPLKQVMELLHSLHRAGSTIVMVTHDARFARNADRTIHVFDGRVVQEQMESDPTRA